MNLFDDVTTPDGPGKVVGFPDHENVEVRLQEGGLWNGAKDLVRESQEVEEAKALHGDDIFDIPRSPRTGRKLTGAALTKFLANQGKA